MATCECSDPQCPVHYGRTRCNIRATTTLFRIDMEDLDGTALCEGCADDAMDSGLFNENVTTASVGNPANTPLRRTKKEATMGQLSSIRRVIENVAGGGDPRRMAARLLRLGEADGDAAADDVMPGRDRGSDPMDVQSRAALGNASSIPAGINVGPGPNSWVAGDGRDHPESPGTGARDVGVQAADSETAEGRQLDQAASSSGEFMEGRLPPYYRRRIAERLRSVLEDGEETGTKPRETGARSSKKENRFGARRRSFFEDEAEDGGATTQDEEETGTKPRETGARSSKKENRFGARRRSFFEDEEPGAEYDTPDWSSGGEVEEDEEGDATMSTTMAEGRRPSKKRFKKATTFRESEDGTTPEGGATTQDEEETGTKPRETGARSSKKENRFGARRRSFFEDEEETGTKPWEEAEDGSATTQDEDEETGARSSKKENRFGARRPAVREGRRYSFSGPTPRRESVRGRRRAVREADDEDTEGDGGSPRNEHQRLAAILGGMNESVDLLAEGPFGMQHVKKKVASHRSTARAVAGGVRKVAGRRRRKQESLTEDGNPYADYFILGSPVKVGSKPGKVTEVYEAPGGYQYLVTFGDGQTGLFPESRVSQDAQYNPGYYH